MTSAVQELIAAVPGLHGVRRLGQALWMKVGDKVSLEDLVWARGLLGEHGEHLLWNALLDAKVIRHPGDGIDALALANLLCQLFTGRSAASANGTGLVWTLPGELSDLAEPNGYAKAAEGIIGLAVQTLLMVSPYLEARGVGRFLEQLTVALGRGAQVTLITHGADDLSSKTSFALRDLRRAAAGLPGSLRVYSAEDDQILIHAKIIVADSSTGLVGSANVTSHGLSRNIEAGTFLEPWECAEILRVAAGLIDRNIVRLVFSS